MQFHLNGFRPGDPEVPEIAEEGAAPRISAPLPAEVDVLIVGCGPAGLTLAAQLAAFADIDTRIVDQRSGPLRLGHADGVACRTMEMFEAFGFADRLIREAYWINETTFWKPDDADRTRIVRGGRVPDREANVSEQPHVILNQARVHDFYLQIMRNAPNRLEPDYGRRVIDVQVDATVSADGSGPAHPVTVSLERIDPGHEGEVETVKARYVVGCDGAHSAVRRCLGRALIGDSANQAWGVMDVLALTDFPDIRLKSAIQSAGEGNLLIIPREGGYLVRIYVELDKLKENERVAGRHIAAEHIIAAAQRILNPYTLEVKEVAWWSVYEIGQRLCDRFDDAEEDGEARQPRVFIAGDACHTHSPKAGQGMNVSMQDSFNLGWKLACVLQGRCVPELLHTYSRERQAIAKELIDFDREWSKMFSDPPKDAADSGGTGIDPAEFQTYYARHGRFTAGIATRYQPSIIVAEPAHQHLAEGFVIGMRFHSAPVVRLADARRMQLGQTITADGRWRVFAFSGAGDRGASGIGDRGASGAGDRGASGIGALCAFLAGAPASPVVRFTPEDADIDSVIDVRAIFQADRRDLDLKAMPALLLPRKGRYGLCDYEKIFCPDLEGGADIFDLRGIDRARGAMVVVRPDQHVAHVLRLDAHEGLAAFFDRVMVPAG
jgi:phenol 2-monooxygenase (NADPH)